MKKLISIICVAVASLSLQAQTPTPPTSPDSFMQQISGWMTTFDTNSTTFAGDRFNISSGIVNINNDQTGINLLTEFKLGSWPVWVENDMRNAVAMGRVLSDQAGINYSVVKFDVKASFGVDLGRRFDTDQTFVAPLVRIKKAIGKFTFLQLQMELPINFNSGSSSSVNAVSGMTWGASTGFVF